MRHLKLTPVRSDFESSFLEKVKTSKHGSTPLWPAVPWKLPMWSPREMVHSLPDVCIMCAVTFAWTMYQQPQGAG